MKTYSFYGWKEANVKDWTPENKTLGQCSITAFLIQDFFSGKVYGVPLGDGRDFIRKFNGAYSYVAQLVSIHDEDLFNEYQYTLNLIRLLPRNKVELIDIVEKLFSDQEFYDKVQEEMAKELYKSLRKD